MSRASTKEQPKSESKSEGEKSEKETGAISRKESAPFGYCWQNGSLVPDKTESPIRKLMYELFLKHRRKKTVARLLNEEGFRTKSGA